MLINNVVIVSGEEQKGSAIHIYVSVLPQTPLPSRLPHNIEQSSMCYTINSCWWPCFPGGSEDKASVCSAGDLGLIPGLGRSPGEGNGNALQYSCLENPMDRGAWWATVHRVPIHFEYSSVYMFIPHSLTIPFAQQPQVRSLWVSFYFVSSFALLLFRFTYKGCHTTVLLLCLISFTQYDSL